MGTQSALRDIRESEAAMQPFYLRTLQDAARMALQTLELMTTDDYAKGADRPTRAALVGALRPYGLVTAEQIDRYAD